MTYVDDFVIPVPKKNLAGYKKMAAGGARVWKKHGVGGAEMERAGR